MNEPYDPYKLLEEDMLAWERWEERVKAAFEDEFIDSLHMEVIAGLTPEMRELLFEAYKAGACYQDPFRG